MTQQEENELSRAFNKSLDQKVLPELKVIREKLTDHDKELKKINERLDNNDEKLDIIVEAVAETKVDITELKEDVNDMGFTVERIETRLNSVIKDHDEISLKTRQLNRRVLKLETKKS